MSILEFASTIGLGALIIKILDIVWLQQALQRNEKSKWLREQRLRVYSKVLSEIMSLGQAQGTRDDLFKAHAFFSEAILLTEDESLAKKLEDFFTFLPNLYKKATMENPDVPESELEEAYQVVVALKKDLQVELRRSLLNSK